MIGGDVLTFACLSRKALDDASPSGQGLLLTANGSSHFRQRWLQLSPLISYRLQTSAGQSIFNCHNLRLAIPSPGKTRITPFIFSQFAFEIASLSSLYTRHSRTA